MTVRLKSDDLVQRLVNVWLDVFTGGRQSGAVLYNAFGVMGHFENGGKTGTSKSNGSTGSQTGSGYSTDVSDDNLQHDATSPNSDVNDQSDSDDQVQCRQMSLLK